VNIDVVSSDLPRELADRRMSMEQSEEQSKLLKFKDDVIWKLSQELKKKYDYFQDEFDKETRQEMNEWVRLVDRYARELKKFELVCAFCGQYMGDQNINQDCAENTQAVLRGKASASQNSINMGSDVGWLNLYYTDEDPPMDLIGKKRHYFAKPGLRAINKVGARFANPIAPHAEIGTQHVNKEDNLFRNPDSLNALKILVDSAENLEF
jgi:hypothetical protein